MNGILKALMAVEEASSNETGPAAGGRPRMALPLAAHYRGEPEHERRRQTFYMAMARVFGFENWWIPRGAGSCGPRSEGRDGAGFDPVRSRKSVVIVDTNAAPFEWLAQSGRLEEEEPDNQDDRSRGIASLRFTAGMLFRGEREKAQWSALRSPNLDRVATGGGGASPLTVTWLEATDSIRQLKAAVSPAQFELLDRIVVRDEWLFRGPDRVCEGEKGSYVRVDVNTEMVRILMGALDRAAVHYGLLAFEDYRRLWMEEAPTC